MVETTGKKTEKETKKDGNIVDGEKGKKVDQTGPVFIGLTVLSALIFCCIFVLPHFIGGLGAIILSLIIIPIVAFIVLWFGLAPSMVIGTFIPEGYCIMITRGQEKGEFVKAMIKWKGHAINSNYDIVKMKPEEDEMDFVDFWGRSHLGMNFYFWPFDKVYSYDLEWKQFSHDEKVINKSEHLYYVLLKPYVYYIDIKNAEDKTKVPQNMGIVAEMMVVNPYKATFMIQNWYRAVSNLIIGDLRDFIRNKSYEELINPESGKSSLNEMIWDQITKNGLAKDIEDKYGVRIIKLTVVEIGPADEEYARATLRRIIAEKNQEAIKVEAQSEAFKRSTETMGLVTEMFLSRTKMTQDQLASHLSEDPENFEKKYGRIFTECIDFVQREMAINKGRFIDIRTDAAGVKGGDSLLALIAANSMLNNQSSSTGGKSVSKKKDNEEECPF